MDFDIRDRFLESKRLIDNSNVEIRQARKLVKEVRQKLKKFREINDGLRRAMSMGKRKV